MPAPNRENEARLSWFYLRENLKYDMFSGVFSWRIKGAGRYRPVGTITKKGYVRISLRIAGKACNFLGHRLAWFYTFGYWPSDLLDHKNGMKSFNSIFNLRDASNSQNQINRGLRSHNTSGRTGVSFNRQVGLWYACAAVNGKRILHNYYATEELAIAARKEAVLSFKEFVHSSERK